MLLELGLSILLVWEGHGIDYMLSTDNISENMAMRMGNFYSYSFIALSLTISLWILTAWIFVPLHGKLGNEKTGYDKEKMKKLVRRNWFRTILWSFRLLFLIYMMIETTNNIYM